MIIDAMAAGLDDSRLGRIDEHMVSRYIEPGKIAGAEVAIVRDGVARLPRSFGVSATANSRCLWRRHHLAAVLHDQARSPASR